MKRIELHRSFIGLLLTFGVATAWATNGACTQSAGKFHAACKVRRIDKLLWTEAEDAAEILSSSADESVSAGAFKCGGRCIETRDFSALEPDAQENKFYAPGVGLILEVDLCNGGARNELVSYKHP
jgi:hypothetical protein